MVSDGENVASENRLWTFAMSNGHANVGTNKLFTDQTLWLCEMLFFIFITNKRSGDISFSNINDVENKSYPQARRRLPHLGNPQ